MHSSSVITSCFISMVYRNSGTFRKVHTVIAGDQFSRSLSVTSLWPSNRLFFAKNLLPSSKDSSVGRATRYELDGPGIEYRWGGRDFPRLSRPTLGPNPTFYTMGTGSFPRVKRPGRGVDHPPPSSAEVKYRVKLYLYSPLGPRSLL